MKRVSLQAKNYYHHNHQVCGNACHVHPFSNVDLHLKVIILLEKIWVCGLNIRRERSIQERVKSDEVGAMHWHETCIACGRTRGWKHGIIGGRKGLACNLRKNGREPSAIYWHEKFIACWEDMGEGNWYNRGWEGFRECSKEKLKGAQCKALTWNVYCLWGRTGGWEPGIIGGRRGLECALRKNWREPSTMHWHEKFIACREGHGGGNLG